MGSQCRCLRTGVMCILPGVLVTRAGCVILNLLKAIDLVFRYAKQEVISPVQFRCYECMYQLFCCFFWKKWMYPGNDWRMEVSWWADGADMSSHAHVGVQQYAQVPHRGKEVDRAVSNRDAVNGHFFKLMERAKQHYLGSYCHSIWGSLLSSAGESQQCTELSIQGVQVHCPE